MRHRLKLVNETHYRTRDLRSFFITGLNALAHGNWSYKYIEVVYGKRGGVWGCAWLPTGLHPASSMRFAIPKDPEKLSLGSLARVLRHEFAHNLGLRHGEMDYDLKYCSGPDPEWIEGLQVRVKEKKARPKVDLVEKRHERVLELITKWQRRKKTVETRLRKLRRQDAYYRKAVAARQTKEEVGDAE